MRPSIQRVSVQQVLGHIIFTHYLLSHELALFAFYLFCLVWGFLEGGMHFFGGVGFFSLNKPYFYGKI